jgi:hypothetical protein
MPHGLHVFEIKSFHSRLTGAHKRQITKSFVTARRNQPDMAKWTLVLPLDLTPSEIKWFEQTLCGNVQVETEWIGLTALESGLSAHTDLLRGLAPGSVERRAIDYLAQYQQEIAAMAGGAGDGVQRLQRLHNQMNDVDPDWAFDIGEVTSESTTLIVRPKDPESRAARPIGGRFLLKVNPESDLAKEIDEFTMYGRPLVVPPEAFAEVSLDLPGGLGDSVGPETKYSAKIGVQNASLQLRGRLAAVKSGKVLATLPVDWNESTSGPAGGLYLAGRDTSGFLEVIMRAGPAVHGEFTMTAPASNDVLPSEALPALRFLSYLHNADTIQLQSPGKPPAEARITGADLVMPDTATIVAVAEALAAIQEATGTSFALPRQWTRQDAEMLYFCDQLLKHGTVSWTPPEAAIGVAASDIAGISAAGPLPRLNLKGHSAGIGKISLMGNEIELPSQIRMDLTGAIVINLPHLVHAAQNNPPSASLFLHLAPDEHTTCNFYVDKSAE